MNTSTYPSLAFLGRAAVMNHAYVGIQIPSKSLDIYNRTLVAYLGFNFLNLRENRDRRDGAGNYHMTVITPKELRQLKKKAHAEGVELQFPPVDFSFEVIGVGTAANDESQTWFAVVKSESIQEWRKSLGLEPHDLHITLGFELAGDVHGVAKGENQLIEECEDILISVMKADRIYDESSAVAKPSVGSVDKKKYEQIEDAVREYFGTEVYWCSRVYEAWGYGTMGLEDFSLASEDDEIVGSTVDIVLEKLGLKLENEL